MADAKLTVKIEFDADQYRHMISSTINVVIETLQKVRDRLMNLTDEKLMDVLADYAERLDGENHAAEEV